jgi:hypothetical protein
MLICLRVSMEWPKAKTNWNLKNCGFSICMGWNDFVATTTLFVIETTCSTNTSSIWMLLIILSKLGLGYSSMLPCMVVASIFSPPLSLISFKQVHPHPLLNH